MQVVHQLPSQASNRHRQKKADPRGYDASKHSLGRGLSMLTQRPLSCMSWDLISTLPGLSSLRLPKTRPVQPFVPPALLCVPNIERTDMHARTPLLNSACLPSSTPHSVASSSAIFWLLLFAVALLDIRVPVPHISRRLTVIDSSTTVQDNNNNDNNPTTSDCHQSP